MFGWLDGCMPGWLDDRWKCGRLVNSWMDVTKLMDGWMEVHLSSYWMVEWKYARFVDSL